MKLRVVPIESLTGHKEKCPRCKDTERFVMEWFSRYEDLLDESLNPIHAGKKAAYRHVWERLLQQVRDKNYKSS